MTAYLGSVVAFGFNFPPKGWVLCQGQLLPINQNQALFALFGTYYGGDGRSTFGLPDLQGRTIVGQGSSNMMGEVGGTPNVTLTSAQMPMHTHGTMASVAIPVYSDTGNTANPSGNSLATPGASSFSNQVPDVALKPFSSSVTVQVAGGSQPFSVMNPYQVLNYSVALTGIFPSRN